MVFTILSYQVKNDGHFPGPNNFKKFMIQNLSKIRLRKTIQSSNKHAKICHNQVINFKKRYNQAIYNMRDIQKDDTIK